MPTALRKDNSNQKEVPGNRKEGAQGLKEASEGGEGNPENYRTKGKTVVVEKVAFIPYTPDSRPLR